MLRRELLQSVFLMMFATAALMARATPVQAASEECRTKPDLSASVGNSHWHYRVDRISQRRCWFLSSGESRMRHFNSLGRREGINRNTEPEIEEQSKLDGRTAGGLTLIQDPAVLSDKPLQAESASPQFDPETSESLVPHQVATISFTQPRVQEQSLGRGSNFDLIFFGSALATALLVAGGVFQIIDRFNRSPRTASSKPMPLFTARRPQKDALSSKGMQFEKVRERFGGSNIPAPQPRETLLRHRQLY
jgi:hypothetical protein